MTTDLPSATLLARLGDFEARIDDFGGLDLASWISQVVGRTQYDDQVAGRHVYQPSRAEFEKLATAEQLLEQLPVERARDLVRDELTRLRCHLTGGDS